MGAEWRTVAFSDFMAIGTRNGIHKGPSFQGHGIPVVKMGEVYHTDVVQDQSRDLLDLTQDELNRLDLEEGDLLFCRTSLVADGVGHCALVGALSRRSTFASNLIRVRLNPKKAAPRYWFYYFRSPVGKPQLLSRARGTSVTTITGPDIAALEVTAPDVREQRSIAHILGTLDDNIELNRRMNETLEEIARALFKSWFVDFDPVRAKSEGRDPGLPSEIADLFPNSFEESELGEIPKGWEVHDVYQIANVIYGAPFKSALFNETRTGRPLIRIRDLATHDPGVFTAEEPKRAHLVRPSDLVVGMDGEFRAHLWRGPEAWLNQRLCCFAPKRGIPRAFVHYSIESSLDFFERSKTGTTVIHLGKSDIDTFRVLVPVALLLERFGAIVDPIEASIVRTAQESQVLAALRDCLLPKLISGQLRVENSSRFGGPGA